MTFSTCLLGLVGLLAQDPLPGIDRDMARARAERVGNVSYRLQFSLVPGSGEVTGSAEVRFTLPGKSGPQPDLVLDFAGRAIEDIRVNEREPLPPLTVRNGHVVLPGAMLQTGENRFRAKVRADAAPTGAPVTVYRDPTDGSEYWYTLVVPADAHRLYPCFDQPDVKARFQLLLEVPTAWRSVANGATVHEELVDTDRKLVRFVPTLPISTYLMAFAAGPFAVADGPRLEGPGFEAKPVPRLYQRPSQQQHTDEDLLFRMHADGLRWMTQCFGVPYPFRKLDIVLLPGFPYGGMEHAGAIFYRESALSFDHPPTESELVRRSTLVHHEIAHQWFGNLVTMRWFDDLWLKEGFATFLGYQCMEELEPQRRSWLRFLQRVKPRAYEVDGTAGTVPVYQSLQNLADAKSAYGPIVYNKAPAVLRELHERLGKEAFREGLSAFLQQHAFGAAEWQDLADALGKAGSTNLSRWSERWLLSPSMPQVRVVLETDAQGTVTSARVEQQSTGAEGTWPLALEVRWLDREGTWHTGRVAGEASTIALPALVGRPMPWCVLPNPGDVAYGQFVPDPASRTWLVANVAQEPDPLVRAVALQALLESVRECELDPQALAAVALDLLAMETDAENHAWLLDTLGSCLLRWQPRDRAADQLQRATALLLGQLSKGAPGRELQSFRFLARASAAPDVLALCAGSRATRTCLRDSCPGRPTASSRSLHCLQPGQSRASWRHSNGPSRGRTSARSATLHWLPARAPPPRSRCSKATCSWPNHRSSGSRTVSCSSTGRGSRTTRFRSCSGRWRRRSGPRRTVASSSCPHGWMDSCRRMPRRRRSRSWRPLPGPSCPPTCGTSCCSPSTDCVGQCASGPAGSDRLSSAAGPRRHSARRPYALRPIAAPDPGAETDPIVIPASCAGCP